MLVVLETFCELHELKKFRKMFYVKKDKDEDQVHIMEHDQLSFSSITDQAAGMKEDQKQDEPFVPPASSAHADGPTSHWVRGFAPERQAGHEGEASLCSFMRL